MAAASSPVPNPPSRALTSFSVLTLDIYGTLVDWETGLIDALQPLIDRLPQSHALRSSGEPEQTKTAVGRAFSRVERALQKEKPRLKYSALLAESYIRLAQQTGVATSGVDQTLQQEADACGASIGSWAAFEDTIDAMNRLHKHFKLVPLSNVDKESFGKTASGPLGGLVPGFDAVYTAEEIGSYKPDVRNFQYAIDHVHKDLGLPRDQILHTAQSLTHDHEPAKQIGLPSVWIARGPNGVTAMGGDPEAMIRDGKVAFSWRFSSLAEMADAVEAELKGKQ